MSLGEFHFDLKNPVNASGIRLSELSAPKPILGPWEDSAVVPPNSAQISAKPIRNRTVAGGVTKSAEYEVYGITCRTAMGGITNEAAIYGW